MSTTPTAIHTDAEGLEDGRVEMPVSDGSISAYFAAPAGKQNLPIVLVLQEIFGVNAHMQDVCRRIAKLGYLAVSPELYQRQGDAAAYTDIPKLVADIVAKVPDEQVLSDLDAAVKWAAGHGGDTSRVGVTGFCWGGRLTWMYNAHNPNVRAAAAWYGRLTSGHGPLIKRNPSDIIGELHGPVLGLYGAQDQSIPVADVELIREKLSHGNDAAKVSEMVVYPDSGHAFFADYRASYNEADAQDAWQRFTRWFAKYLG
jgi:carboxymethylenebutenolidase